MLALVALIATPTLAQSPGGNHSILKDIAAEVSSVRQKAALEKLVGFGTRHTGSEIKSEKRGIGAARRWIASEFSSISKECDGRDRINTGVGIWWNSSQVYTTLEQIIAAAFNHPRANVRSAHPRPALRRRHL